MQNSQNNSVESVEVADISIEENVRNEIEEALNKFEDSIGLPRLQKIEAPTYLNMNVGELRKKSVIELSEASIELNRYSFYIQRIINKNKGWERWAKSRSDEVTAILIPKLPQYYGFNERELIARTRHPLSQKINKFLTQIRLELDRLYDVPNQIKIISDSIKDLKFATMREDKHND